jgi:hypothetical protein
MTITMQKSNEERGRLHVGTTFFRTIHYGTVENLISVELVSSTLTVKRYDPFNPASIISTETFLATTIETLRVAVNSASALINMPERGIDVNDQPYDPYADIETLTSFGESFMVGASGLPVPLGGLAWPHGLITLFYIEYTENPVTGMPQIGPEHNMYKWVNNQWTPYVPTH